MKHQLTGRQNGILNAAERGGIGGERRSRRFVGCDHRNRTEKLGLYRRGDQRTVKRRQPADQNRRAAVCQTAPQLLQLIR